MNVPINSYFDKDNLFDYIFEKLMKDDPIFINKKKPLNFMQQLKMMKII